MKNFIKIISVLIFLFTSSCGPYWYKPYGKIFKQAPKDGTPGYRTGWMHGCESGLSTQFGSAIMMTFYKWKKDPLLSVANPDLNLVRAKYEKEWKINWNNPSEIKDNIRNYKTVFWIGHIFCRHAILGTYQLAGDAYGGSMDPTLAGDQRYQPGGHNLGNIYSFQGRGNMQPSLW